MAVNPEFEHKIEKNKAHAEPAVFEFLDLKLDEELSFETVSVVSQTKTEIAVKTKKLETPLGTDNTCLVDSCIITAELYSNARQYITDAEARNLNESEFKRIIRIEQELNKIGNLIQAQDASNK